MNIQPIEQGSLSARAYVALREGLIAGQFRPGQRLVMQDLAERFGTSVTPVREACLRLVSERGLELRAGRFVTVPARTLARYLEVRSIRLSLVCLSVYRLSGMDMLVSHIESLWVSMGPMLTVFFREGEHRYVGASEHRKVIDALRDRDEARARKAMEHDLIIGGEDFLRFLKDNPQFAVA